MLIGKRGMPFGSNAASAKRSPVPTKPASTVFTAAPVRPTRCSLMAMITEPPKGEPRNVASPTRFGA